MQLKTAQGKFDSQETGAPLSLFPTVEAFNLRQSDRASTGADPFGDSTLPHSSHPHLMPSFLTSPLSQQIAEIVATQPFSEAGLAAMAATIATHFEAEGCIISLGQLTQFRRPSAVWLDRNASLSAAPLLATYSAVESIVQAAINPLIIPDLLATEMIPTWQNLPIGAVLGVKTQHQGQVNGVITLVKSHPHSWTPAEIDHLIALGYQVGGALSPVLLQQQIQEQAQYQSLMRQLTMAIRNAVDLPQILKLAAEGLAQVLHLDQATVFRIKYWDPRHSLRSGKRIPRARVLAECEWRNPALASVVVPLHPVMPKAETPLSNSFWVADCVLCQQLFAETTTAIVLNDYPDFPVPRAETALAPLFDPEVMPALLLVPLESKQKILGFLALQQSEARTWQPAEIELVEMVAAQLSSAIIQTETLRQVESLVEERTAQLQQSLELQAKLYEITRKQIEKLRVMNQRMDEFLSTLSHELRTPLTSMMLAIRMLRDVDLSPDRRLRYLNILEQQCTQEANLVNDLLALQELEANQVTIQMEEIDLRRVLADRIQEFEYQLPTKGLTLSVNLPERSLMINTDRSSLNRVLLELLTNAGKYADPNTTIHLEVTYQAGQQIMIAVANQGAGISEEELPHIFDKFRRCQGMTQNAVPGTGLGLALVKSLMQHLNGTITATSHPLPDCSSYETHFTITLPQDVTSDR
jgi:signal transduction histidine kinase